VSLMFAPLAFSLIAQSAFAEAPADRSPSPAQAPGPTPVSVSVSIGRGKTWDDEGSIGNGTWVGGGVAWRFRPHLSVGAEVERLGHERDTTGLQWSGRTVLAGANVMFHFGARGISHYVGGGVGGAFYEGRLVDRFTTPARTTSRSSTSTMAFAATGLEIPIGDRFALAPELRVTMCQPRDNFAPWSLIRFGVKGSMRF
jgi:hypothetical protein